MRKHAIFLAAVSLLFLFLALPPTLRLSLYHDEVMELPLYEKSPLEFIPYMYKGHLVRPPLFGIVQHYWMAAFGQSELALRSPSLIFSVACIPLIYAMAHVAYGLVSARIAVLLFSTSPFALLWGRAAGWYPMMMAWVLLANLMLLRLTADTGSRGSSPSAPLFPKVGHGEAVLYGVSLVLALYTNYYAVALLVSHALYLLFFRRDVSRRPFVALAVATLVFVPWVPAVSRQFDHLRSILNLPEALGSVKSILYVAYSFLLGETILPSHNLPIGLLGLGAAWVLGTAFLRTDRRHSFLWSSQIFLMLAAGLLSGSLAPYRAFPFVAVFFLVLAAGMGALTGYRQRFVLVLALLFPAWSMSVVNLETGREFLKTGMLEPWRGIHAKLSTSTEPDDLVIHRSEVLAHYNRLHPMPARLAWLDDWNENPSAPSGKAVLIESFSSYRPDALRDFEEARGQLEKIHGSTAQREVLMRDPWWREKQRWAPEWAFREEKVVLYEFSGGSR